MRSLCRRQRNRRTRSSHASQQLHRLGLYNQSRTKCHPTRNRSGSPGWQKREVLFSSFSCSLSAQGCGTLSPGRSQGQVRELWELFSCFSGTVPPSSETVALFVSRSPRSRATAPRGTETPPQFGHSFPPRLWATPPVTDRPKFPPVDHLKIPPSSQP